MIERIPITDVAPVVEHGRYPVKAVLDETLTVRATVFREGHDALGAGVVLTDPFGKNRATVVMEPTGVPAEPDRFAAPVAFDTEGAWSFRVESWSDPYETWRHAAAIKIPAEIDVELMLTEGCLVLQRALRGMPSRARVRASVVTAVRVSRDASRPARERFDALTSSDVLMALARYPLHDLRSCSPSYPVYVDRERALVGSWYEFFPRSEGAHYDAKADRWVSGTFATAAERLPAIAEMGFDVVYLPPIHPIGEVNRKGPNNTLVAHAGDPGSPWAIGSHLGGNDTVHPDLGTMQDFDDFVAAATRLGLEVALDLALQCAPDHPWVAAHPEWFNTRADGSVAYAENPPKKYQDIYPLNFDKDLPGLSAAVLAVVRRWMDHGVRIFRVDNPHTKPVAFWEWLLAEIRKTDPDVLFLSEAFTRPAMLRALGMVGFHQSYTYFTWRNAKWELESYLAELAHATSDIVRPNLFVNTPDILTEYLQHGGPAAFKVRATIAATGSPSWGVYSGFELCEHRALRPGSEEYLDSEKYQYRPRDWAGAAADGSTLAPYLTLLNRIRRRHPALQRLRNLTVHSTEDDSILCFSKRGDGQHFDDIIIVVVNLDPHHVKETLVHLDLPALGFDWFDTFAVEDEISGGRWHWGESNYVRLDPAYESAHILSARRW
ncbi:MAG TPA: alpha-1,4-glucan--maltose-1-phosphate maltosyltransferase [Nocardioidaceae bacterium]|nr:alpha-1,4-glucan--maltose-1-phosphate maltosyltransferase [Nocardioidaceae bacterium]